MNAKELYEFLKEVVEGGNGHATILFDTEARTFGYHMAEVGRAYLETEPFPGEPFISLHEKRHYSEEEKL